MYLVRSNNQENISYKETPHYMLRHICTFLLPIFTLSSKVSKTHIDMSAHFYSPTSHSSLKSAEHAWICMPVSETLCSDPCSYLGILVRREWNHRLQPSLTERTLFHKLHVLNSHRLKFCK